VLVLLYHQSLTVIRHMGRVGPTYANLHHAIRTRSKYGKQLNVGSNFRLDLGLDIKDL